jgi:FtsZ-interacting cell division protein ZipA
LIFCLEDRAVLCRDCDVSIHASNTLAANHKRFLSTGIRVSLYSEQQEPVNVALDKPHDSLTPPPPPAQVIKKIAKPPADNESTRSSSASSSPLQSTQSSPPVFQSEASDPRNSNSIKPFVTKSSKRTAAQQSENVPAFQAEKKAEEWQAVNVLDLGMGYPLGDTTLSKVNKSLSLFVSLLSNLLLVNQGKI